LVVCGIGGNRIEFAACVNRLDCNHDERLPASH
jgi:hypothetical protein